MQLFNLLKQAQQNNGPNENDTKKNFDNKHESSEEFIESEAIEEAMNKHGIEEGILNEGQNPEPLMDDSMPEQIREVDPSFEETKMSVEDNAALSEDDGEEVKQSRELQMTDKRIFQSAEYSNSLVDRGSPHSSKPHCIFAPDLVDSSSPQEKQVFDRQLSPNREINVFVDDTIVISENPVKNSPRDQKPGSTNLRFDTEPQIVGQDQEEINQNRNEMTQTQVSVATFTGMRSERKSVDKETIRSSKAESQTRTKIKSHFRKSNSKGQHTQVVNNADSQDIEEFASSPRLNAFDLTEQSGNIPKNENGLEQLEENENEPSIQQDLSATNTQWHDVQIVPTEDGNQELVIENLENLQNSTALIVTRHGNQFKIGIQEEVAGASENLSQKDGNTSQQNLIQKLKLRGKFGKKRPSETLSENKSIKSRGSSKKSRQGNEHPLKLLNQTSSASIEWQNKYKTFQDPLPENNKKDEFSPKQSVKSKITDQKPEPVNAATQYSPSLGKQKFIPAANTELLNENNEMQVAENNEDEIKSQSENSLSFVKVVDPNQKNDKRDQNDINEKRGGSRKNREGTSTANDEIRDISGRAQRSLNSRQVTGPSIPPTKELQNILASPESRRSRISVRLQDKLGSSSANSSMNMSDAQGQVKLKVKKKNDISRERSDLKSPTHRPEREKKQKEQPIQIEELESVCSKQSKDIRPIQSTEEGIDINSRFQLEDQPSRISVISRRSNADQKGQHLIRQNTVKESEHEESPEKQSLNEEENVLARDPSEEKFVILPEKEMMSTPESTNQNVVSKALQAEIATQTQSSLEKLEKQKTLIESKFNQSVRSSKKILYNSSKRSLLNRSTESIPNQESEQPPSTNKSQSVNEQGPANQEKEGKAESIKEEKQKPKQKEKQTNKEEKNKRQIKQKNRTSSIESSDNKHDSERPDVSKSHSRLSNKSKKKVTESPQIQASEKRRGSQSEQKGVNIRKIRSPASIKTLEPSNTTKQKESKLGDSREKTRELNKTVENFSSMRSSQKMREGDPKIWKQVEIWFAQLDTNNNGFLDVVEIKPYLGQYFLKEFGIEASKSLIKDAFDDLSFDGKNVTKQGLYDHIVSTNDALKADLNESQKKKQPAKKLSSRLEQHQQQKPLSVQSRNSNKSQIQQEEASQNYHTQTEDLGDAIFPQIMRYTETGPQESILSRDHYSTSNHASIVSRKDRNRAQIKRAESNSITTQPQPSNYLKKLQDGSDAENIQERKQQNQSNQKLKSIPKPKKELKQYNDGGNAKGLQHQMSRVEQSHPEEQSLVSIDNENFQTSDGLTPVLEEERNLSQGEKINIEPSTQQTTPLVAPTQHLPKLGAKKGKLKNFGQNKVPALHLAAVKHPESDANNPAKKLDTENQEAEYSNTTPNKNKLPALAQSTQSIGKQSSIGRQSKQSKLSKSNEPLRSSGRLKKNEKKRDASNPVTDLRNSKTNPLNDEPKDNAEPLQPIASIDGGSIHNQTQPIPAEMLLKGKHASEVSGNKSQRVNSSILPAVVQNRPNQAQQSSVLNSPYSNNQSSKPTQRNRTLEASSRQAQLQDGKPIMKYMEASDTEQKSYPLKYFKGQDLELYYMEKQLKPGVEREIKEGFFEIRKKFGGQQQVEGEEVQVYVSHLCLHNYHPIFCKFNLDVVKTILNFSQIIYLKKGQTLYERGFNDKYLYVILFGKLQLLDPETDAQVGQALNIGWTVGEEILFKSDKKTNGGVRLQKCKSLCDSCVLGIEKRSLAQIKRTLVERREAEEFVKLEVVLRGNYLVKKNWRQQ